MATIPIKLFIKKQWRIQDFPQGGTPTPKIAIIFQIFAENCMKMKEFGPPGGGARPWRPPLDPPMKSNQKSIEQDFPATDDIKLFEIKFPNEGRQKTLILSIYRILMNRLRLHKLNSWNVTIKRLLLYVIFILMPTNLHSITQLMNSRKLESPFESFLVSRQLPGCVTTLSFVTVWHLDQTCFLVSSAVTVYLRFITRVSIWFVTVKHYCIVTATEVPTNTTNKLPDIMKYVCMQLFGISNVVWQKIICCQLQV